MLHYEESLRLLDRALAIDPNQELNANELSEETKKKSAITLTKLSRTRQQVIFRIHELRTKANAECPDPPPTYEESEKDKDDQNTPEVTTVPCLPSDAEIMFTIAGKVQIFYIGADGKVSAPSYPSSLFVFRFKSEYQTFKFTMPKIYTVSTQIVLYGWQNADGNLFLEIRQ